MRERTSCLVEQGSRDIAQSVSSTHNGDTGNIVDLHVSELREVDDQVPICTSEAIACVRMAARASVHCPH